MRIHTNTLTVHDLHDALATTGLRAGGVRVDTASLHNSRKRKVSIEFRLSAEPGKGRRRRNTGYYGAEDAFQTPFQMAATYDEHGIWMAELFERDPEAIIGYYDGRDDFHEQTKGKYR